MAVAEFEPGEACDGIAGNYVQFRSHEIAVARVHSIARPWCCGRAPASDAAGVVETIVRIGQPKAVTFDRDAQAWMRPELQNASDVMDVLQREEIHITVEPVITRKKIVESLMLAIMRIAVARAVGIFKAQPR